MARAILSAASLVVLSACAVPDTVARLQDTSPPPEFGRPGWVRACAGTGAWIGGIVGGVLSVVALPVTYPLSLLAGDHLGTQAHDEFLFFPATGLAATGHFLFGAPPDLLDHVFHRAWTEAPAPTNTYDLVPMEPPKSPSASGSADAAAAMPPATGATAGTPAGATGDRDKL